MVNYLLYIAIRRRLINMILLSPLSSWKWGFWGLGLLGYGVGISLLQRPIQSRSEQWASGLCCSSGPIGPAGVLRAFPGCSAVPWAVSGL